MADGAAGVRAQGTQAHVRRHSGSRPAAGAAGDTIQIPGVAGNLKAGVLGGGTHGELIHVKLAHDYRSGIFQSGNDCGVVWRNEIFKHLRRAGRAKALGADQVLDTQWDAGKGCRVTLGQAMVRRFGLGHGTVGIDGQKGTNLAVDRLDAIQDGPSQFHGSNFFIFQQVAGLFNGQFMQFHGIRSLRSCGLVQRRPNRQCSVRVPWAPQMRRLPAPGH